MSKMLRATLKGLEVGDVVGGFDQESRFHVGRVSRITHWHTGCATWTTALVSTENGDVVFYPDRFLPDRTPHEVFLFEVWDKENPAMSRNYQPNWAHFGIRESDEPDPRLTFT